MRPRPLHAPRLAIITDARYLQQAMPTAALDALERRGLGADLICSDGARFAPDTGVVVTGAGLEFDLNTYDAVLARSRNGLGLAMVCYAEAAGVLTINSHTATERIRNKVRMAVELTRAGFGGPSTVLARDAMTLAHTPATAFPLILKPTYGDNSRGLVLARQPEDLAGLEWGDDCVLAQAYLASDGFDLKLYVCGTRVYAVRKPSPFNGDPTAAPRLITPTPEMIDLAHRCGALFGLEIFGVDTIETSEGPAVIEVNEFPNFSGIPEAGERIVEHVLARVACHAESEKRTACRV